jgi:hypothetical protein
VLRTIEFIDLLGISWARPTINPTDKACHPLFVFIDEECVSITSDVDIRETEKHISKDCAYI